MTQTSVAPRALVATCLLLGLSSNSVEAGEKALPSEPRIASKAMAQTVHVEGQVFIVTKGQQVFKLPLVSIIAVSEDAMTGFLRSRALAVNEERRAIFASIRKKSDEHEVLKRENQPLKDRDNANRRAVTELQEGTCGHLAREPRMRCIASIQDEIDRKKQIADAYATSIKPALIAELLAAGEIEALASRARNLVTPQEFLNGAEQSLAAIARQKTDADGRFSFDVTVLTGKRIAVLAQSNRLAGTTTEHYRWLVWVATGKGTSKVGITLANDNLFDTECSECVSYKHLVDKSY